jgi:hypothetical protein
MKVSFKARGKRVSFTAKPTHHRVPKQLKKFLFKPGTKRLATCLRKARKAHRAWLRSR